MLKKLKILYATNDNDMIHDNRFLIKFIEHGHEVHYVSFIRREIKESEKIKGINYYNLPVSKKSYVDRYPLYRYPIRYFKCLMFLKEIIRKVQPNILHAGFVQISGVISSLSNYKPLLIMPFGHDILKYKELPFYLRFLTRYAINKADYISVDAEFVKDKVVEFFDFPKSKISVFPWGVDRKVFSPVQDLSLRSKYNWEKNKVIIMNRGFQPRMDVKTFINAIPDIVSVNPDARFLLLGASNLDVEDSLWNSFENRQSKMCELECRRLVIELNIQKYVKFEGAVPNNDIGKYLSMSDLFVSTSLSDGSSVALVEAISCSLPIVATKVPAFFEWINDGVNGNFVNFGDSFSLSKAINDLLKDNNKLLAMRNANLEIGEDKTDWNKNYEVLEETYQKLVDNYIPNNKYRSNIENTSRD